MTRTIPHRELRNNSSAILREVAGGESFAITNNGEVVALLVPPGGPSSPPLRRRPARVRGGFAGIARARLDHPVQEDLDALRDDR